MWYNSRELYYFAVKSDWSKSQLELLSKYLRERDEIISKPKINVKDLGKEAINLTTSEERKEELQKEFTDLIERLNKWKKHMFIKWI